MIDKLGGRKVLVTGLITLIGVGLVFLKGDVPANFLQLLQWIFTAFVVGNGVEHVTGMMVERGAPAIEVAPALDPALNQKVAEVDQKVNQVAEGVLVTNQTLQAIIQRIFPA